MDTLYIVVPCYNETEVLRETTRRLLDKMDRMQQAGLIDEASRILYVDDGSKDGTWELICRLHEENPRVSGVKLSRNRGHQNALLAGLMTARDRCDCAVSMDADLQDDIEVLDEFVSKYDDGCDIVYGVRSSRGNDTAFKKGTAEGFYKLMEKFGVETVYNHADYRLMSDRALNALSEFGEVNLFLRGIVPQIGYKTDTVSYVRGDRFAGESKYPLRKMLSFAMDGITSFSSKPIEMLTGFGIAVSAAAVIGLIWALIAALNGAVSGLGIWILLSVWLACGLVLTGIGIVGLYVGRTYMETKHRPRFLIETVLDSAAPDASRTSARSASAGETV